MRKLYIVVLLLNFSSLLNAQDNPTTELDEEILYGRIKRLSEKFYEVISTVQGDSLKLKHEIIYNFNIHGRRTERLGLEERVVGIYNDKQRLEKSTTYDQKGAVKAWTNLYYDDHGNKIKQVVNFPKSNSTVTYYFDYFMTLYTYDGNNNLIEKKEIEKRRDMKKETLRDHRRYQYDLSENLIVEEELSANKAIERMEYKYANNRLVEKFTWQLFEEEDLYIKDLFEYNEDETPSLHLKLIYDYGSTDDIASIAKDEYIYIYDSMNRLIEKTKRTSWEMMGDTYPQLMNSKYADFDSHDNWQQKQTDNNGVKSLVVREFEYYE